ncbi:MAG: hypothetical protein QHC90_05040 [Shinella sp.]|nr:hypothetical protein [Shinella sp.]
MALKSRFLSNRPEDVQWRVQQMHENNAIEGVVLKPGVSRLLDDMAAEGLSPAEKLERLRRRFRVPALEAAE